MCVAITLSLGGEVFNFSDSTISLLQNNGAIVHPDAAKVTEPVECFDLGSTGTVEIPNVALPQGPFSIMGTMPPTSGARLETGNVPVS